MEPAGAAQFIEPLTRLALGQRELAAGLRAAAAESTSRRLQRQLRGVAGRLEAGGTLSEALAAAPALCPSHVRELLAAGAANNRLGETLLALGRHERRTAEAQQRLRSTILYPLILLSLLAMGSVFLLLFVAAPIKDMLAAFEDSFGFQDLVMARSGIDALWPYRWPLFGATIVLIVGAAHLMLRSGVGKLGFLVRRLPLVGPVWRWIAWAQSLELWVLYLRAGVPLPQALIASGRSLGDPVLARRHDQWAAGVSEGQPLGALLEQDARVPPTIASLLAWGDSQGALADGAETAAGYCRDRIDSQLTFVEAAVPPIALAAMVIGLAYMYSLLLLPLRALQALT